MGQESVEAFPRLRSPRVVNTKIGIVLGLPKSRVAVGKQDLQAGVVDVIVSTDIDHGGRPCLCGRQSFRPMRINFRSQRKLLSNIPLQQPSAIGEIAIPVLSDNLVSGAAVGGPVSPAFLRPDRQLVPDLTDSQPFGIAAGGNFQHRKGANLRAVLGLFYESILRSQFNVLKSIGAGTDTSRKIYWVVGRKDGAKRKNDVQVKVGSSSPIGFQRRADRVGFRRGSIRSAE